MELTSTSTVPSHHPRVSGEVTLQHRRRFAVGIDVGQAHDPTAICVASRIDTAPLNPLLKGIVPKNQRYEVLHLERLPLGKTYPQQVDHIERLSQRAPFAQLAARVLVDYTG